MNGILQNLGFILKMRGGEGRKGVTWEGEGKVGKGRSFSCTGKSSPPVAVGDRWKGSRRQGETSEVTGLTRKENEAKGWARQWDRSFTHTGKIW